MEEVSSLFKDFFKRIQEEVLPWIINATVPFYAIQNDKIVRDRSGVFLRVGDDYFILTAAHGLRAIITNSIYLHFGWSETDAVPVPIADAIFQISEEEIRDIAVIKLSAECARSLASSYRPISLSKIAKKCPGDDNFFLVVGYPQDWLAVVPDRIESMPLNYVCRPFKGEELPTETFMYTSDVHFLLGLQRQSISSDTFESSLLPPKEGVKGISGCGVWQVAAYSRNAIKDWNPADVRLVGVENRYWEKQGAIAATKIEHVMDFLIGNYPNVIPAMKLLYP